MLFCHHSIPRCRSSFSIPCVPVFLALSFSEQEKCVLMQARLPEVQVVLRVVPHSSEHKEWAVSGRESQDEHRVFLSPCMVTTRQDYEVHKAYHFLVLRSKALTTTPFRLDKSNRMTRSTPIPPSTPMYTQEWGYILLHCSKTTKTTALNHSNKTGNEILKRKKKGPLTKPTPPSPSSASKTRSPPST